MDQKEFENKFNHALQLKNSGEKIKSLEIFQYLAEEKPKESTVFLMLRAIYWDLGKIQEAVHSFGEAVKLKPNSEKLSLGYFHTLWENGEKHAALEEIKRFLTNNSSDIYNDILEEINEKW